ncbi:MAG TPA: 30S ribosomal protein S11 [Candidatus Gracilibacteria bacterium]|nr:30S ribosomal protein S11 [Candidatus Gracilibacteria bacterium]HRY91245.1 30S ribosomal protein S11 [Candidatus Gracilibacteria bacterium]
MPEEKKSEEKKEVKTAKATETAAAEGEAKAEVKAKKKAKKRLVPEGKAYVQSSFNNTIITITDPKGDVIAWSSAGGSGFKGPKKATPYAAQVAAESAATKAKVYGFEKAWVFVKGAGTGREQAIRGLQNGGIYIEGITDVTAIPHNGCRSRKSRRV